MEGVATFLSILKSPHKNINPNQTYRQYLQQNWVAKNLHEFP